MSDSNSNSRPRSSKPTHAKSHDPRSRSSRPQPARGSGGQRFGQRRRQGGSKRPVVSFEPSNFIKKVEERVIPPVYVPKNTFSDFPLEAELKQNIVNKGYTTPTPIQDQA